MSKGQHGNKEAKKPKKAAAPANPLATGMATPVVAVPARQQDKGKKR